MIGRERKIIINGRLNDNKPKLGTSISNSFKTEKYNKIKGKYLINLFFKFKFF